MKLRRLSYFSLFFVLFLGFLNCAKRGTPTGGPKDETPPSIISSRPENNTTNFKGNEIRITFDEYIKLKDLQKQLIVSPPLEYTPIIYPQGSASKYIDIEIQDTLQENSTYVFNFGQSVVDNTEGNPYSYFSYVFSTGDYIDSLNLGGFVADAELKKPDNFISVMLYKIDTAFTDSIIYKKPPTYITNTLDSAVNFNLSNLKDGKYMLIAMKDNAGDHRFDPKSDKIAFLDHYIEVPNDTLYQLTLFKEIPAFRATRPNMAFKNMITFGYEGDPEGMEIKLLSDHPQDFKYTTIKASDKDSINYYFTPFETDSLLFEVGNKKFIDTFTVRIRDLYNDSLAFKAQNSGAIGLEEDFMISSNVPMESIDDAKITIMDKDSVNVPFTFELDKVKNLLNLKWEKQPEQKYRVEILPESITDFFEKTNDTLKYGVSTKSLADLGSIRIKLRNVREFPLILQLTNDKGVVQYEQIVTAAGSVPEFKNIDPGNYLIRVIHDRNSNGKWDTGNYLKKIQPEDISYYPESVELRANWEIEQTFTLE
ncbi:Ig-like domain-containing protein [Robertkochia solimangrovi]|uniref:Ig-like domain-containing protein n=1 Tax=Robertkochia solimangrovi TaxID=2213046 RepID=UPI0011812D27|nr:Ig-like domain-containing protein [Robertkochia solimangrovi]TRZ45834.1 hypothetical protein DMZ48_00710 [Robertkochia solimangrovi]